MEALGVKVVVGPASKAGNQKDLAGVLLQYPNTKGAVLSYGTFYFVLPYFPLSHRAGAVW
jgi:glycine cleavage system pyridoxal-binding protein P